MQVWHMPHAVCLLLQNTWNPSIFPYRRGSDRKPEKSLWDMVNATRNKLLTYNLLAKKPWLLTGKGNEMQPAGSLRQDSPWLEFSTSSSSRSSFSRQVGPWTTEPLWISCGSAERIFGPPNLGFVWAETRVRLKDVCNLLALEVCVVSSYTCRCWETITNYLCPKFMNWFWCWVAEQHCTFWHHVQ